MAIVLGAIVNFAVPGISYVFSFITMLIGGFVAGWMVKEKPREGTIAGILSGLIYVILGSFVIYPVLLKYHPSNPGIALIFGIVLGDVGGFLGKCLHPSMVRPSKHATITTKTSTRSTKRHSSKRKSR